MKPGPLGVTVLTAVLVAACSPGPAAGPASLPVETEDTSLRDVPRDADVPEYRREAFGEAWLDIDGNGCNQRDDVLLRDAIAGSTTVAQQGACDHDVLAGEWRDPYTGALLVFDDLKDAAQAQAIQIDHVVPLAEAWRSGAAKWDEDRRIEFANDLDGLLAVDGPTNQSKSDQDPASWRPRQDYQCDYARRWINMKTRWDLGADPSERRALDEMLATC